MTPVVGVLLAAGSSRRFGQDKRHYRLPGGDTLLSLSLAKLKSVVDRVVVVVRPGDERLAAELESSAVSCCINARPDNGIGSSIACGVGASPTADGWLIMPVDLPLLRRETVRKVSEALHSGQAVVPTCEGKRGHPVAFAASFRDRLAALDKEGSGRELLQRYPSRVHWLHVDDAGIYRDLDSVGDLGPILRDYGDSSSANPANAA